MKLQSFIHSLGFIVMMALLTALTSCQNHTSPSVPKLTKKALLTEVFNSSNIESQMFVISGDMDTIIEGRGGTRIFLKALNFVDSNGNAVHETINIELKEANSPFDWVLANLTTTYQGQALESGGMIYLDATSEGRRLEIAKEHPVKVSMPTMERMDGMSFFAGEVDTNGDIKWMNPEELERPQQAEIIDSAVIVKTINMTYSVDGFSHATGYPKRIQQEVGRIAWAGDGLKITKDSTFQIDGFVVQFYKQDELSSHVQKVPIQRGSNSFVEDANLSYIFTMKKLGWANIDRLLKDPRTELVAFQTTVENQSQFDYVYTTLVTQKMYLPGYQKGDSSYSFTHGDQEEPRLPIGETATILATSKKGDDLYFAMKTLEIKKEQAINLKLEKTSKSKMKELLGAEI